MADQKKYLDLTGLSIYNDKIKETYVKKLTLGRVDTVAYVATEAATGGTIQTSLRITEVPQAGAIVRYGSDGVIYSNETDNPSGVVIKSQLNSAVSGLESKITSALTGKVSSIAGQTAGMPKLYGVYASGGEYKDTTYTLGGTGGSDVVSVAQLKSYALPLSGGTVTGNLVITGNLTVNGTEIINNIENLAVKDEMIYTNSEGATLAKLGGIGIKTNKTDVYGIVYDTGSDSVKLGLGKADASGDFTFNAGEGEPVATRADSSALTDGHLMQWDGTNYKIIDSGKSINDFVSKVISSGTERVYGITTAGGQETITVSESADANTIVKRTSSGTIEGTADKAVFEQSIPNGTIYYKLPHHLGTGTFTLATTDDLPETPIKELTGSNGIVITNPTGDTWRVQIDSTGSFTTKTITATEILQGSNGLTIGSGSGKVNIAASGIGIGATSYVDLAANTVEITGASGVYITTPLTYIDGKVTSIYSMTTISQRSDSSGAPLTIKTNNGDFIEAEYGTNKWQIDLESVSGSSASGVNYALYIPATNGTLATQEYVDEHGLNITDGRNIEFSEVSGNTVINTVTDPTFDVVRTPSVTTTGGGNLLDSSSDYVIVGNTGTALALVGMSARPVYSTDANPSAGQSIALLSDLTGKQDKISVANGISISGPTIYHTNNVTAGTIKGEDGKTLTFGGTFKIPTVTFDAQGHITTGGSVTMTMPANPNTHYTTKTYVGASGAASNAATSNGSTYLKLYDDSTLRTQHLIKGSGSVTVASDASGNITISGTDTDTGVTSVTTTGSGNAFTAASVSGRVLTLTKGSTFLTSHQSIKTLNTSNTTAQTASSSEAISGSGTINLHKVSKTGSYEDLLNKPTAITEAEINALFA